MRLAVIGNADGCTGAFVAQDWETGEQFAPGGWTFDSTGRCERVALDDGRVAFIRDGQFRLPAPQRFKP